MKRALWCTLVATIIGCDRPATDSLPHSQLISTEDARDMVPMFSPDGSQVAYWRPGSPNFELWVANADLSGARSLGISSRFPVPAIWSPDGAFIAAPSSAASVADVVLVTINDGSIQRLTHDPTLQLPIAFHPDGDRVIYGAYAAGGTVSTFSVSRTTGEQRIFREGLEDAFIGVPSPDGSQFVYTAFGGGHSTVWLADSGGVGPGRALTTEGFEGIDVIQAGNPWSPDGQRILYTSTQTGKSDIWVASVDGSVRQLTTDINNDWSPTWSPDGRWVAFLSDRGRQTDVWVMPAAGGDAVRVTDDQQNEDYVRWKSATALAYTTARISNSLWRRSLVDSSEARLTPDSLDARAFWMSTRRDQFIYLIDRPGGAQELALMPAVGGTSRALFAGTSITSVVWSGDDSRVAFQSDKSGTPDVWVTNVAVGATPRQLTDWVGWEGPTWWSADGARVGISASRDARLADLWSVPVDSGAAVRLTNHGSIFDSWLLRRGARIDTLVLASGLESGAVALSRLVGGSRLVPLGLEGLSVRLSPAGNALADLAGEGGTRSVVANPDGRVIRSLGEGTIPTHFSSNGRQLLYLLLTGGRGDVRMLDVDTGQDRPVVTSPENEADASFTSDPDAIILTRTEETQRIMQADVEKLVRR